MIGTRDDKGKCARLEIGGAGHDETAHVKPVCGDEELHRELGNLRGARREK